MPQGVARSNHRRLAVRASGTSQIGYDRFDERALKTLPPMMIDL